MSYALLGLVAAKLSWVDPSSFVAINSSTCLLCFTRLSRKSSDFYFLVGTHLKYTGKCTTFQKSSSTNTDKIQIHEANNPDSKVYGANMGPTWVLSAPDGPHVGPMNLATRESSETSRRQLWQYHMLCCPIPGHPLDMLGIWITYVHYSIK